MVNKYWIHNNEFENLLKPPKYLSTLIYILYFQSAILDL